MMEVLSLITIVVLIAITAGYFFIKWKLAYWDRQGVINLRPESIMKLFVLFSGKHNSEWTQDCYRLFKGKSPVGGAYIAWNPVLVPGDLDLVKNILIKDFNSFHDRGTYYNERDDPLTAHLFNIEGQKWRTLRSKLSPTFTSGKMKFMFPTVVDVSEQFVETLNDLVQNEQELEVQDLLARFTTDIIGSCAFGIECNSLKDPDTDFRVMGKKIFEQPKKVAIIIGLLIMAFGDFIKILRLRTVPKDLNDFFMDIVRETIEYRERNNVQRNDFMNLLIELKNGVHGENATDGLTIEEIAAQAFVFFLAGFETSSRTLAFCLYELAQNQEIQNKARDEIHRVLEKYNGKLTYEAMIEMQYLEQILNETLRKYPPLANLMRVAKVDYKIPNTNLVIRKGERLWIPIYAIQRDPEIYPDPEVFDPDRFTPDECKKRHPMSFLTFGDGPRNCVGLRFGMMQSRIGLIQLIRNFKISVGKRTPIPLEISAESFILSPVDGMWLKIEKLSIH